MACTLRRTNCPSIYRLWHAGFIRSREAAKFSFGKRNGLIAASCARAAAFWCSQHFFIGTACSLKKRKHNPGRASGVASYNSRIGGDEYDRACRGPRAGQPFPVPERGPVPEAPEFPAVFGGQTISLVGTWMDIIAEAWLVYGCRDCHCCWARWRSRGKFHFSCCRRWPDRGGPFNRRRW